MSSINVNNQSVHYREWGGGTRTLLMLHGWPADSTHYAELGPMLGKLNCRIIVPDLPGWGQTPPPPQAWGVSDYCDWVHAFVQAMGLKRFVLFGHSFGGRIAIKYAVKYPYELEGLVLCAAAGMKPNPLTIKRRVLKLTASVGKKAFALPGVKTFAPIARRVLYKAAGANDYLKAEGVMKQTIVKVLDEDLMPLLGHIALSTKLIWGSADTATPLEDGQKMQKLIAKSSLQVIPGGVHNLPKRHPREVAQGIASYLKEEYANIIE